LTAEAIPLIFALYLIAIGILVIAMPTLLVFCSNITKYQISISDYDSKTYTAKAKILCIPFVAVSECGIWYNPKTGKEYIEWISNALNAALVAYRRKRKTI
jgi:hypothetical protein